jgi:hypothetical protein
MKMKNPKVSLLEADQLMLLDQIQSIVAKACAALNESNKKAALHTLSMPNAESTSVGPLLKKTKELCLHLIQANFKRLKEEGKIGMSLLSPASLDKENITIQ